MKVIDLLNKIAKGEEVPKKINEIINDIKYGYKFNEEIQWYETLDETSEMNIFMKDRLNHKVEIIEEEKEIEELNLETKDKWFVRLENGDTLEISSFINLFNNKINELVRELNKIKKEGK